jgi:hypothetical protein
MAAEKRLKTAQVNLRLEPKLKVAAEKAAESDHRSLTSLVEKLLTEYLRERGFLKKWHCATESGPLPTVVAVFRCPTGSADGAISAWSSSGWGRRGNDVLSEMEYPHWLMVAGALLVVAGFLGLGFSRYLNREPAEDNLHPAAPNSSVAGGAEGEAMSIVTDLLDDRGR